MIGVPTALVAMVANMIDLKMVEKTYRAVEQLAQRNAGFDARRRPTVRGLLRRRWSSVPRSLLLGNAVELGAGRPKVCVPLTGPTVEALRKEAEAVSPAVADLVELGVAPPSKFEVVPLGLDLDPFLALDGNKKPCRVRASNAGQLLFTGLVREDRARLVAADLMSQKFFSGWGIRTVAVGEARYNPMSYHNGSVWPHDNALIADGMARYGFTGQAMKVFSGLREACLHMDQHRMPELFCGFIRKPHRGPTDRSQSLID